MLDLCQLVVPALGFTDSALNFTLLLLVRALAFVPLFLLALALHRDHRNTLEYPGRTVTLEPTEGEVCMNSDTPITEGINSDGVVRPQGRKGTKEKKRRLNDENGVVEALCNLQSTLEKQIKFNEEELELKKEKDKKEFELREQTMKKKIELKEKAQKIKEKDQQLKEKNQRLKEKEQKMKEKAQKRQEQDRILNQDVNKLPLALRSTFEIYQAQILKEWESDGLFGKVFTSSDEDK
ncbi:hypothetical protein EZV62_010719 [Acer yangbiense]|uniref:No apical meristem-associated C-terminal domain-containing protein n=1 Tax=Acer yangbiense TaxID=1000413 RepID=A0A5C7I3M9_9ROSI|nr:hypothetical protein EZV62_010719 [Acer yangbiense]